jgi:hypothetical protein
MEPDFLSHERRELSSRFTTQVTPDSSAIGIIFELSHVGGEVRVRQFVANFEYTPVRCSFGRGSANPKKPAEKRP